MSEEMDECSQLQWWQELGIQEEFEGWLDSLEQYRIEQLEQELGHENLSTKYKQVSEEGRRTGTQTRYDQIRLDTERRIAERAKQGKSSDPF